MRGISSVSKAWLARAPKVARALLCGVALLSVAGLSSLRVAKAEVGERLLGFGAELANFQSARPHGPPRRLSVNGLELGLLTLSTRESVHETLDRFQARCRARGGFDVPDPLKGDLTSPLDGTIREESESEGIVACIDTGQPLTLNELSDRLGAFSERGDLAALGELRYAFARRNGSQTTVVALWTSGSAPLLALFPKTGDAPGLDPREVPRPPASRRFLSGREHGMPYSLTLYRVENQTPDALRRWYESALVANGWQIAPAGATGPLMVHKADRSLSIHVNRDQGGRTVATVAELS